ncbi:MAG: ThiF family adenylyltransferase [Nanoarchaeota archaeon]
MRYVRQVIFEKIGKERQKLLERSAVAVVGLGALGSVSSELLARAGIGKLILIDRDIVELSNLQRQSLFDESDISKPKALITEKKLSRINSSIDLVSHFEDLSYENVTSMLKGVDLVLDCTDNFYTRLLINDFCVKNGIPWVYSAVIGSTGACFNILPEKPCLSCIIKEPDSVLGTCDTEGILNTTSHAISSIQVTEALKILTRQNPTKEFIHYDIWANKLLKLKVHKNANCNACNGLYNYLDGLRSNNSVKLCGSSSFQFKANYNFNEMRKKLSKNEDCESNAYFIKLNEITIFKNCRVVIKADSERKAKVLFSKYLS